MSPRSIEARIEPSALLWARLAAGYDINEVSKKIGVDESLIEHWESGEKRPTLAKARRLADIYKRPVAAFYLQQQPEIPVSPTDFRTLPADTEQQLRYYSPQLILSIRKSRKLLSDAKRLLDLSPDYSRSGTIPTASIEENPIEAADRLRDSLNVPIETQSRWKDSREAFDRWAGVLQNQGVLVTQMRGVPLDEARAYSIVDDPLAAIAVNPKDSWNARVFSIFHEYSHIALGQLGVCDLYEALEAGPAGSQIEVFCNRVSGFILMPVQDILSTPEVRAIERAGMWDDRQVIRLARRYNVSFEAVLRQLQLVDLISYQSYMQKRAELQETFRGIKKKKATGGPSPAVKTVLDNGLFFTSLVLDNLSDNRITLAEVSDLLGVRLKHLDRIEDLVSKKRQT